MNRIMAIFRHLQWFGYIQCDITLSFLIDSAGRYLFRELCLPWHSVHHPLPQIRKRNNVRETRMNFQISGRRTALISIQLITKSGATSLPDKSAGCEWFEAASDWCVSWSETERYWRLTSGAVTFEPQEDVLNIHHDIWVSQNIIINCKKRS